MDMSAGDEDLAAQAAQGDTVAFELLLDRHYNSIFRLAYQYFGTWEEAEDIAQGVCVSLAERVCQFDRNAKFTSWLFRVVRNACHDAARRNRRRLENDNAYVDIQRIRQAADKEAAEDSVWLYQALNHVGEDYRETALLVLGEDLTHAQAGEILQVSEKTISWRMHKLREKLRAFAEEENEL